jgi:hypothetical protein
MGGFDMDKVFEDAWRGFFGFVSSSIRFLVGLLAVLVVPALSLGGELVESVTPGGRVDWRHVAKVVGPSCAGAAVAYLYHTRAVAAALATVPPGLVESFKQTPGFGMPGMASGSEMNGGKHE